MPKYRKLHTRAVESLDINDMPDDFTRLLWVLMPLALDREGRGLDNSSWVKSKLMPLRVDITLDQIAAAMDWYAERGMIERYSVQGRSYFWLPTFRKYQGDTSKESESEIPPPKSIGIPGELQPASKTTPELQTNSAPNWSGVTPDLLQTDSGQNQSNSGVTPDLLRSNSGLDADAYAEAEAEAEARGAGAPRQRPPPKKPIAKKTADLQREQLRIDATEGGRILVGCYERLFRGARRRVPVYYANSGQREAFLSAFEALGGELQMLIEKGFARERVRLADILAWLEACVERNRMAKAPPGSSPGISEADLIAAGYRRHGS